MQNRKLEHRNCKHDEADLKTVKAQAGAFAQRMREEFAASLTIKHPDARDVLAARSSEHGSQHITPAGGNIFEDLGFSPEEAAALKAESLRRIEERQAELPAVDAQ